MTGPELAVALVADLNAAALSRPVTAVRAALPLYDLGAMDDLHVTVVLTGRSLAPASRHTLQIEHRLDIAIQQRLPSDDPAACDGLLALVGEIADHLAGHHLAGAPGAVWVKTEHAPLVDPVHLHELRQFTAVLVVTYRTWEG
jgi:hypothetical protein